MMKHLHRPCRVLGAMTVTTLTPGAAEVGLERIFFGPAVAFERRTLREPEE